MQFGEVIMLDYDVGNSRPDNQFKKRNINGSQRKYTEVFLREDSRQYQEAEKID